MAGYRCVNFSDLCRLCSNAGSNNIQIYTDDSLLKKIHECLPITLNEKDKLPRGICSSCKEYVEVFSDFRKSCSNAQKMLEGCLNTAKLRNGGQVYIKDETPTKKVLKPIQHTPTKLVPNLNLCNIITTTPTKQVKKNVIASPSQPDFLSSIMQAVGIQAAEEASDSNMTLSHQNIQSSQQQPSLQSLPQYTLTLDGNTLKSGQIQYKIENAGNILSQNQQHQVTLNQVDEFLKLKQKPSLIVKKENINTNPSLTLATAQIEEPKDNKKPKFNLILQTTSQKQQPKVQQQQIVSPAPKAQFTTSPNKAQILNIEKILPVTSQTSPTKQVVVPIMVRSDGGRNTISGNDAAAQLISQALSMSTHHQGENKANTSQQPFAYVQMKIQPNADGQLTLTPATVPQQQLQLSLSPQQLQQLSFQHATHQHQHHQQQQQQQTITIQPSQMTIPSVPAQDTQTQTSIEEKTSDEIQDDDIYNDTYDDDYYPMDDTESLLNESEEKPVATASDRKASRKSSKHGKSSKNKSKNDISLTELQSVNAEHSEMAKKQLNLLSSYNSKRVEAENAEKSGELNLTVCDVCKKIFKRKEFLMQHLKSHIGLRPFKCDEPQCNKSFSRKEHLLRHISSHTGKKEFTCNICNKLFSRKDNLNKHKRIHPETGQNVRHNCQNCDKGFSHRSQFVKHQLVCDGKTNDGDDDSKDVKVKSQSSTGKKGKLKSEKKEVKTVVIQNQTVSQPPQQQQQPKIVQVLQQPQMTIKNEAQPQQIILSMSQAQAMLSQSKPGVYTIPTNFIFNPNGNFVTAAASSNDIVGNIKFETQ